MNARAMTRQARGQRGFILATVLIFLVVLSLTAFLAAKLTRTDIQVVNNLQNEKEALTIAEAGVHEALYRMSLAIGNESTVNGRTFNASLAPIVPGRPAPAPPGTSYGPDSANSQTTSQIIFTTSAPSPGTNNEVPTLQPTSLQVPYSFGTADTAPVESEFDRESNPRVGRLRGLGARDRMQHGEQLLAHSRPADQQPASRGADRIDWSVRYGGAKDHRLGGRLHPRRYPR